MRKRKSPIVLITLLVVVAAGVTGFNFASSKTGGPTNAPAPAPEVPDVKAVGEARPGQSQQKVAGDVQAMLGTKGGAAPKPAMPEGGPDGPERPGAGPMILNPSRPAGKPEKPKPNTSSTSAQWYNDESAMSKDKG